MVLNTVIDFGSLAASMEKKMMGNQHGLPREHCCIFRTPTTLSRHNEKAYVPDCFSIGPFHHYCQSPNLKASEKIKLEYLRDLLHRLRCNDPDSLLKELLHSINEIKAKARGCYAENLDHIPDQEFVEMLVVDGCFIIEIFRKDNEERYGPYGAYDPVFSIACMIQFLYHDLILLENQIPWLVLEVLFEKTKPSSETKSLVILAVRYFRFLFSGEDYYPIDPAIVVKIKPKHIVDLLWWSLVLPSEKINAPQVAEYVIGMDKVEPNQLQRIPSANRLIEAGVTLVRAKNPKSILDLKYNTSEGVLQIPSLGTHEITETFFRNLISYEQCLPNCETYFTSYAKIMDNLIDTKLDMEILCKNVFYTWLGPEDATRFFNKLYNDTYVTEFHYEDLCFQLNKHCEKWVPKWRTAFVQNYYTKPWALVAIIYATIMLILTALQVVLK